MGHIVSHEVFKVDPNKIKVMMECPIPKTLNNLKGFLGLTSCYHNFVKNNGRIVAPITTLLKKDAFSQNQEGTQICIKLKEAMCINHILPTLNFTKTFIVECSASRNGIGANLL